MDAGTHLSCNTNFIQIIINFKQNYTIINNHLQIFLYSQDLEKISPQKHFKKIRKYFKRTEEELHVHSWQDMGHTRCVDSTVMVCVSLSASHCGNKQLVPQK